MILQVHSSDLPSIRLDPQNPNLRRSLSNMSEASLTLVERAKRDAAYAAIDQHVQPDMQMVGIGSGSTIVYGVERIAAKTQEGVLGPHIKYVPTSFQVGYGTISLSLPRGKSFNWTGLPCCLGQRVDHETRFAFGLVGRRSSFGRDYRWLRWGRWRAHAH